MAYSFNDIYRPLRLTLRINGLALGLGLGGALLLAPISGWARWGIELGEPLWPARLGGAALVSLGGFFFVAAAEEWISRPTLFAAIVAHVLIAAVMLTAYFQGALGGLTWLGQTALVLLFALCLVGAVAPLRYIRIERALI